MRDFLKLLPFFLGLAAWTYAVQSYPFFWDTVQLASKQAHHFFENGLCWTPLPPEIDSGHPPVFGYYLALVWHIAGKTLPVSHWAMFPFLCGIVWLLFRLGRRVAGQEWALWLIPLAFLDPVIAGQSALVSPDIVLACCFLLATEGLLSSRNKWVVAGIFGLCAISMRGMMTAGALFLWQAIAHWRPACFFQPKRLSGLAFLPGFAFAAWFLWWHQQATGWTGYHAASPWAPAFEATHGLGLFRNLLVIGWRWTDFGRVFEWAILVFLVFRGVDARSKIIGKSEMEGRPPHKSEWSGALLLLLCCLVILLTPSALLYKMLSAHRYFLPLFLAFHVYLFYQLVQSNLDTLKKRGLLVVLLVGMFSGNCWIYPRGISMDWDATLAHLPYHRLRSDMIDYIEQQNIDFQSIGTAFPNINTGENLLLNGDKRQFIEKDFVQNKYILVSNIFNDFSEKDIENLEQEWILIQDKKQGGVWMRLYKSPE